jgi:hypothetical protein
MKQDFIRPDESEEEGHYLFKGVHNRGYLQGGDRPQSCEFGSNNKSARATIENALLDNEYDRDQGSGSVNDVKSSCSL